MSDKHKALAIKLYEINAFKFGNFKIKAGINSPVYFDLRVIVSYPEVMKDLADLIASHIKDLQLTTAHICGVPYTALPIATLVSVQHGIPMLIRRKEKKDYGTKKLIEGIYSVGDNCLIVEDVITSGSSVLETVRDLEEEGIKVTDAVIVVDREQGGADNIAKHNVRVHSLFTLSFLLQTLHEEGKINSDIVDVVAKYIAEFQLKGDVSVVNSQQKLPRTRISFQDRADLATSELAKQLFLLMVSKKSNLCLAADLTKTEEILNIADACGPYICVLKMHIDIVEDFNLTFIKNLRLLADKHNFLLMEDRKFADIGNTVSLQYGKGIYKIADWADLVTAHALTGRSVLEGLKAGISDSTADVRKRGVFLLAELSNSGSLIDQKYSEAANKIATEGSDFVVGIVCQSVNCFNTPSLVQLTPGVKIDDTADLLGQQYQTPEHVVKERGADIGVVGRGILQAKSVEKAAELYRDRLWTAYNDRIAKC